MFCMASKPKGTVGSSFGAVFAKTSFNAQCGKNKADLRLFTPHYLWIILFVDLWNVKLFNNNLPIHIFFWSK